MTIDAESDLLHCDVCCELYDGPIMQCVTGHSVCSVCAPKLENCPTCKGTYMGTRNYTLESIVRKFNESKAGPNAAVPVTEPKAKKTIANAVVAPPRAAPNQDKGLFQCRIILADHKSVCEARLPISRLFNHLRYKHLALYSEHNIDLEAPGNPVFSHNIQCRTTVPRCEYVHINSAGLFAINLGVKPAEKNNRALYCWVQGAFANRTARKYSFRCRLVIGGRTAVYSDYVYGDQSDATYIQLRKKCLYVSALKQLKTAHIQIEIFKTCRAQDAARSSNTTITE